MEQFLIAGTGLAPGLQNAALTVVWLIAIGLGVFEYSRSKGRIGRALMVTLGGGLLLTFVINPTILTTTVPNIFKAVVDWAASAFA